MTDIYKELERSVVASLKATLTLFNRNAQVIIANQGKPEPKKSYIAVQVIGLESQGQASKSGLADFSTQQALEYAAQSYKATVQLNFFGDDAGALSMLVSSQTKTSTSARQAYLRNNLAPRSISVIRAAPQLRDTVWVNGYALDMTLGFTVRTIQEIDWVDAITVNDVLIPLIK